METSGSITKVSLSDVPASTVVAPLYSGTGVVNAVGIDGSIIKAVGTINYDTGTVELPAMKITSLLGTEINLRINVNGLLPKGVTAKDVILKIIITNCVNLIN